jgi:hypothetical protein
VAAGHLARAPRCLDIDRLTNAATTKHPNNLHLGGDTYHERSAAKPEIRTRKISVAKRRGSAADAIVSVPVGRWRVPVDQVLLRGLRHARQDTADSPCAGAQRIKLLCRCLTGRWLEPLL